MANVPTFTPDPIAARPADFEVALENIQDVLEAIVLNLNAILQAVNSTKIRENVDEVFTINNQPQTLSTHGRRHNLLWVQSSMTCQIDNLVGFATVTLYAGWNVLDIMEGARIQVSAGPGFNAVYRCTDYEISGAII